MVKYDIIIPVFNEGPNIIKVLESLRVGIKRPFRVLICYDFDEDNTLEALRSYEPHPIEIVLVKNKSRGPHAAVLTGFAASQSPAVLVFPADDDYNAGMLDGLFEKFEQGCDIVAASRFMRGGSMVGCPWLKSFLVRSAAFSLHYLARVPTHDPTNGFRLFSRRVLDEIHIESTQGFTYSLELTVKAHRLRMRICEVPAQWFERSPEQGRSNFKVLGWLPAYLRWYFYAFATTYLRRRKV